MDPMKKERDIDQWLESALSQYGKAEPRSWIGKSSVGEPPSRAESDCIRASLVVGVGDSNGFGSSCSMAVLGWGKRSRNESGKHGGNFDDTQRRGPEIDALRTSSTSLCNAAVSTRGKRSGAAQASKSADSRSGVARRRSWRSSLRRSR